MSTWIPISERLPTREDADERGYVLWAHRDGAVGVWLWDARETTAAAWAPVPPYTPPKPGPTDTECKELIYRITNEAWDESAVMEWFADVTARIEREGRR